MPVIIYTSVACNRSEHLSGLSQLCTSSVPVIIYTSVACNRSEHLSGLSQLCTSSVPVTTQSLFTPVQCVTAGAADKD